MKTKSTEFIWMDGKILNWNDATVHVTSHALHYGTAVFEGIRAYAANNNLFVFRLREHMERLHRSAAIYSLNVKYSPKELCDSTLELLNKTGIKESCYIRPLTIVGQHGIDLNVSKDSPTHTIIIVFPFDKYFKGEGIRACISSWRRIHDSSMPPMSKAAGNYLNSILATQESKRNGYDESIMLDMEGNVSEASGENIFAIRNNKIYTPLTSCSSLEGITRDTALTIAKDLGYEIVERPISRAELYIADEIFLTGTAAEITAVTSIDGMPVGKANEGPVTKSIRQLYSRIVLAGAEQYSRWLTAVW
ncbi:MAG TPA: branched-chain amino acid transaminase [Nitrososphaeraceae archaeon]|nr:branched-chain amino acid transaminase [Nitrososphaeraceae archaeon]